MSYERDACAREIRKSTRDAGDVVELASRFGWQRIAIAISLIAIRSAKGEHHRFYFSPAFTLVLCLRGSSHILMVLSRDPDASFVPSGENDTLFT